MRSCAIAFTGLNTLDNNIAVQIVLIIINMKFRVEHKKAQEVEEKK